MKCCGGALPRPASRPSDQLLVTGAHIAYYGLSNRIGPVRDATRDFYGDHSLFAVRQAGKSMHVRQVLLLLPVAARYPLVRGRTVLLSRLPRGLRCSPSRL